MFLLDGKTSASRHELKSFLKSPPLECPYRDKVIENVAAIIIQSWWKQLIAQKYYNDVALQISELALWDGDVFNELITMDSEPILHQICLEDKIRSRSDD